MNSPFYKKYQVLLLLTLHGAGLFAQPANDTIIHIPDVIVSAPRSQHFRDDLKTDIFNLDQLNPYAGESLGHFLQNNTAINVKAYGVGGALADISLRGGYASHVQVNWNGFPINSVTLGTCDFSMIPATGFDRVSVVYGAPGALYGSGTFGGAVNLDNNLKLENILSGSSTLSYESLKTVDGSISLNIANKNIAWKASAWGASSGNEFSFYDYLRQSDRTQTDGRWQDAGTVQQVMFRLSPSSTLEAGVWYQVKAYDIPSRIGSVTYEHQKDSTLKVFTSYRKSGNRWGLQLKAAMFNDYERYTQKASAQATQYSIDSRISSRQVYTDANFRYYLLEGLSVDAGITGSYITANVSAYGQTENEKGLTLFAGARIDKNRLSGQAEIRKEWNSDFHSGILPSIGFSWKMIPGKWTLRANISQKFRKPTFNDLFWKPGGNPDLKPESGYSIEIGSSITALENERTKLSADLGTYWSAIDNMIVWRPDGAFWAAKNYQSVRSTGLDGNIQLDLTSGILKFRSLFRLMLNLSDVKTSAPGIEEQMLYSPRIITSWENSFTIGKTFFRIIHHFTSDRFYDDYSVLKPFQTLDVQAGIKFSLGKGKLGVNATVNNLTGTTYELIRLYPMPGRYWGIKIYYSL